MNSTIRISMNTNSFRPIYLMNRQPSVLLTCVWVCSEFLRKMQQIRNNPSNVTEKQQSQCTQSSIFYARVKDRRSKTGLNALGVVFTILDALLLFNFKYPFSSRFYSFVTDFIAREIRIKSVPDWILKQAHFDCVCLEQGKWETAVFSQPILLL